MFWILVLLQIMAGIIAGESAIRKTKEGAATLQKLSEAGFFFLKWRAFADYKRELLSLQKIFGIAAIIFCIIYFVFFRKINDTSFILLPGLFIFLTISMKFGINFRKSFLDQLTMMAIFFIVPWALYLLDFVIDFQTPPLQSIAMPLATLGILQFPEIVIVTILSCIGLVAGLLMAFFSIIVFSIVPLLFLFLMAGSSSISKRALLVEPSTAYNLAILYCFLVGPILIAMESKGIIKF